MSGPEVSCREIHAIVTSDKPARERAELLAGRSELEECLNRGLETTLKARDWYNFEAYNGMAYRFPSPRYVAHLSSALDLREAHVQPGDVLLTLGRIRSSDSIPALERVLEWRPEWDEFDDIAFKALDALAGIDTDAAWRVIESVVDDERGRVRETANSLLASRR
ncbi:hypothetical protein GCM10022380_51750 [Amycolatopsis tucumanensis]|uniref:Uncharacterized protein n=1 Tax=Amycolatopsis tucumanensis TaxID=401106 RepID=A0ABP7ITI1_9PSEU